MSQPDTEPFYRQLLENLGVAVIATDEDLKIRQWNAAAARTFGAAAERMLGTPAARIIPRDRRRLIERILRRTIRTGETIPFEFQHRNDQGLRRELAGTSAPIVSASGERIGASLCIRDITERIESHTAMSETRKMVALVDMAGAMAHHFNNILGSVVTSIDFARASEEPAIQHRVLAQVAETLQRASDLVHALLAFAEGDQRGGELADLSELLNELTVELEQKLRGTGIRSLISLSRLPVIPVPRTQVRTILTNIAQNAMEAMAGGGVLRIDVSTDKASVIILVEDTGRGLDEAAKSRIFEPFWTTKGAESCDPGRAAGLGLAIAHGLVNMLGGTISVTSEIGKGTCFRVTLPLTR